MQNKHIINKKFSETKLFQHLSGIPKEFKYLYYQQSKEKTQVSILTNVSMDIQSC